MAAKDIAITLGIKDNASPVIDGVLKHLTGLERPSKRAGSNLASAFNVDRIQKVSAGFRDASFHVRDLVRQTTALVPPLAAITSAASLAGLGALAGHYADLGTHLKTISARADVPIQQLQHLQDAVYLGGGDPNGLAGALTRLHDAKRGFLDGTDPAALQAFANIDFKREDVDVPVSELFEHVQNRIREVFKTDPMRAETKVGIPLLGGDYSSIAPAITRPNWRHYETEAAELNPGMSDDDADGADLLREKLSALEVKIKHIGEQIGADLSGPLASVATAFGQILHDNQQEIGAGAKEFGDWLKSHDWQADVAGVKDMVHEINEVIKSLGGWKTAVEVLGAAWALNSPTGKLARELTVLGAYKIPRWVGLLLGIGEVSGSALAGLGAAGYLSEADRLSAISGASGGDPSAVASGLTGEYIPPATGPVQEGGITGFIDRLFGLRPAIAPPSGNPRAAGDIPPTTEQQKLIASGMGKQLINAGLTREGAAAVLGAGVDAESGFNPHPAETAYNVGHQGHFQWDPKRQARIAEHFHKTVADMNSAEEITAALWETQTYLPDVWKAIHGHDLAAANKAWTEQFEAPGNYDVETPNRLARTQRDLAYVPQAAPEVPQAAPNVPTPTSAAPAASGPDGKGLVHITIDQQGRATAQVLQPGNNFDVTAAPTAMPMMNPQGG